MSDLISKAEVLSLVERMMETYWDRKQILSIVRNAIEKLPSAERKDWMEQNKDRILQAGKEGRKEKRWLNKEQTDTVQSINALIMIFMQGISNRIMGYAPFAMEQEQR